jgi:hypothetical protein
MAECTKPAIAGSGVCPGQTTGRGILDDAVALVRGDRFLSIDFNANTLTQWGASKVQNCTAAGAYGGVLPGLIFNALPGAFTGTSPYALLPFYTPEATTEILKGNKALAKYEIPRPISNNDIISIQTQAGCKAAFADPDTFRTIYNKAIKFSTGKEFMIGWDEAKKHDTRSSILHRAFYEEGFEKNAASFFSKTVKGLIVKNSLSFTKGRHTIDIVRDVTNIAPILFLADRFALPLKTAEKPRGLLTIYECFTAYLVLFIYQGFDIIPANTWKLRDGATKAAGLLKSVFETHLKTQYGHGIKENIVDWMAKGSAFEVGPQADRYYHALRDTGLPVEDLAADSIGVGTAIAGNLTQQASLLIDLYLSPGYEAYKDRIVKLAFQDPATSERELQGFVFEGMRHAGVVPGLPRVATKDTVINDGTRGAIHIRAGQTVLVAISKAAMDPEAFPDPEKINPLRSFKDYTLLGHGLHFCFGARLVGTALAATLREVFKLKNLRRAPGRQGKFSTTEQEIGSSGIYLKHYLDASSRENPVPSSLTLEYDA